VTYIWFHQLLIVALALAAAGTVAALTQRLAVSWPRGDRALAGYRPDAAPDLDARPPNINAALGLTAPAAARYLTWGLTGALWGGLLLFGLPFVPASGGAGLAYIVSSEFLKNKRRAARVAIEAELPTFVSRLGGMMLVTSSPREAVEEITATLLEGRPLRIWLEHLLAGWRQGGGSFLEQAHLAANEISPLLGLTVYQIRRLEETGGSGFVKAFATTAAELSAILEARAVAGSKAEGARMAVLTMLGIMGVILMLMLSTPSIRAGYANPTAQLIAAGALGMMAFGYTYLNGMIAEALAV